jgi:hypothetical protein
MQVVKNISIGLDLSDSVGQCNPENILHITRGKYVGRCYHGCLITSVDEIVRKGECVINPIVGVGTISLILRITAIQFPIGYVITGCKIEDVNDRVGVITCSSPYAFVILKREKVFESLRKGQLINVQVKIAKYSIGAPKVSVSGSVYLPQKIQPVYKIIGNRTLLEGLLTSVKERIAAESAKVVDPNARAVFVKLVSAYATPQKPPGTVIEIDQVLEQEFVSRDARLDLTKSIVAVIDKPEGPVLEASYAETMIALYEDHYNTLRLINEMIEVYNTPALINDHANLWNIYKLKKIEGV